MELSKRAAASTPQPYLFTPTGLFEGNDGAWSTFVVRIGTPAQGFRVMVSTFSQQTWIPLADGCLAYDPANCGELRGALDFQSAHSSGFRTNLSTTWHFVNLFDLALENSLDGYAGGGLYGLDTVGLQAESAGPSASQQLVAGIVTKRFMFGVLGLGPKRSFFSDYDNPQQSLLWTLKNQSTIPSLSFGYSAGASYRKALGSLVLGGYDVARFNASTEMSFYVDTLARLVVSLQVIVASSTLQGIVSLLPEGIIMRLDSTVPEIWLPLASCQKFENAFGLQFDNETGRYLVNDTIHAQLLSLNPVLTFNIANQTIGGKTLSIVLPYAAFDLQVGYPIYANATNYFPIRRAMNATQYVIGRTFLQEAYIVVDWERANFSVAQRTYTSPSTESVIVPIAALDATDTTDGAKTPKLDRKAIIGISIGATLLFLLLIALAFFWNRRRQKRKAREAEMARNVAGVDPIPIPEEFKGAELSSPDQVRYEVNGQGPVTEIGAGAAHEIGGREVKAELPAS